MRSKEKVVHALAHKEDEVPIDFGATAVSGIHVSIVEKLRTYFGLKKQLVKMFDPYQCLGYIDDDLAHAIGIDTVMAGTQKNKYGIENKDWKVWKAPWGQEVLVAGNFHTKQDAHGNIYAYPQGDTSALPSAKMPQGSYFFDDIIRQDRLPERDEDLHLEDNLEEFILFSKDELKAIVQSVDLAFATGRAVVFSPGNTALGDIAKIPAVQLKHPKGIRDITEWYISTVTRKDFIASIFSYQMDIAIENLRRVNEVCGDKIDVIFTCGTDFGTQTSTFCSLETFRQLYKPFYQHLNTWIHEHTNWKIFKHTDGAIFEFIPDFIECGFDILNPMQCSAVGMDPVKIKKEFGNDIVIWGGVVDTQKTLPFGSPDEVRAEVLQRCEIFGKGGGYVCNAIHNVQAGTPVRNVISMIDAIHEYQRMQGRHLG